MVLISIIQILFSYFQFEYEFHQKFNLIIRIVETQQSLQYN